MHDPVDSDLEQMSGSRTLAEHFKEALQHLADGVAGPTLAEMARDILAGRIDLRTVARSQAYADDLTDAIHRFQQWQERLTPDEREQLLDTAQRLLGRDKAPAPGGHPSSR